MVLFTPISHVALKQILAVCSRALGGGGRLCTNHARMCVSKSEDMGPFSTASEYNE